MGHRVVLMVCVLIDVWIGLVEKALDPSQAPGSGEASKAVGVEPGLLKPALHPSPTMHCVLQTRDSASDSMCPPAARGGRRSLPGQHALNARRDFGKLRQAAWCGGRG